MDKFNSDNYNVLYRRSEIAVLELKPLRRLTSFRNVAQNKIEEGMPSYVFLFRDEIIPELYNNPMLGIEGCNLTQLVASAYKEMFYQHFQRGEVWKGRALERELGYVFMSITAQSLYEKCSATHWGFKAGQNSRAGGAVELSNVIGIANTAAAVRATAMGSRFIRGETPINGKQNSTMAIAELTINSNFIWTTRGNGGSRYPLNKLVIATAITFGDGDLIPTFGEMIVQNADKIRQFVA